MVKNCSLFIYEVSINECPVGVGTNIILMKLKLCVWGRGTAHVIVRLLPFLIHKQLSMEILMIPG